MAQNIDKKLDTTVDNTRRAAGELAEAMITDAPAALAQASKTAEDRLTERSMEVERRLEETLTMLTHCAEGRELIGNVTCLLSDASRFARTAGMASADQSHEENRGRVRRNRRSRL